MFLNFDLFAIQASCYVRSMFQISRSHYTSFSYTYRENDKKQKEENEKKQLEFARSTCKQKIDAPGFDVKFINEEIGEMFVFLKSLT